MRNRRAQQQHARSAKAVGQSPVNGGDTDNVRGLLSIQRNKTMISLGELLYG